MNASPVATRSALAGLLAAAAMLAGCEAPPPESSQIGFRGVSMATLDDPDTLAETQAASTAPPPSIPLLPATGGPKARDVFRNVQVLGDLEIGQFNRLMVSITEWIAPEQGCTYCHLGPDMSLDDHYAKVVSRRMLEMTRHINGNWTAHVGDTGVTCFTCHRGQPVPPRLWFEERGLPQAGGYVASRQGQNLAMPEVAFTSLPYDPLSRFLLGDEDVSVQAARALPRGDAIGTKQAEHTYALMMHLSESLGVNCTYCHNSRAFGQWPQSPPAREKAWYGIRMVRDLNREFLVPLGPQYPSERLGPHGDPPKASCATCHGGQPLPLNGARMLDDFPSLAVR